MNVKEFISSGIIESYVLGLATDDEAEELIRLSFIQKEIREAIRYVELKFEILGLQNAIPPPKDTWSKIKQDMDDLRIQERIHKEDDVSKERAKRRSPFTVINLQNSGNQILVHKYWRPAFIAVFILAKIFLILGLFYYFKADSLVKENQALRQQVKTLK